MTSPELTIKGKKNGGLGARHSHDFLNGHLLAPPPSSPQLIDPLMEAALHELGKTRKHQFDTNFSVKAKTLPVSQQPEDVKTYKKFKCVTWLTQNKKGKMKSSVLIVQNISLHQY